MTETNRSKLMKVLAVTGLTVALLSPLFGHAAASTEEAIRARIDNHVRGLQQRDVDMVAGIFKPDAMWQGANIHSRARAFATETFAIWDNIRVRADNLQFAPKEKYMVSRVMLNLKARVKSDGSPVEENVDIQWLWENTPNGWLVIGERSKPGPVVPGPPPPPLTATDRQGSMPISIEVIGFGIKPGTKEEKQLQEVASKGGGGYRPAANADELIEALKATVEKSIRESTPPPKPQSSPSGDGWQSIRQQGPSGTESRKNADRKKRPLPEGHKTPYGF